MMEREKREGEGEGERERGREGERERGRGRVRKSKYIKTCNVKNYSKKYIHIYQIRALDRQKNRHKKNTYILAGLNVPSPLLESGR